jgi:hypothetical protein
VPITTNVLSSNPVHSEVLDTALCDKVCQWLAAGQWFSSGTPVSSTNKTDRHNITEKLLKVALGTLTLMSITIIYIVLYWFLSVYVIIWIFFYKFMKCSLLKKKERNKFEYLLLLSPIEHLTWTNLYYV